MRPSTAFRDGLHLRSVTLRSESAMRPDALRARQALERALVAVDARAAGLPPEALLIARRVAVGDGVASRRPGVVASLAQQVGDALREHGRAARRPWRDPDAAAADAVWFEDEQEFAACLVRDWLRGVAGQRWWWRVALGDAGVDTWLRTELLRRGERLAPVLQRLATVSLATAWLARMDDADADAGFAALARAYGLPQRVRAASDTALAGQDASDPRPQAVVRPPRPASTMASAAASARRRLHRIVPELDVAAWRPSQTRLLAYGLAVLRAPAEVRGATFAADVASWRPSIHPGQGDDRHEGLPAAVPGEAAGRRDRRRAGARIAVPARHAATEAGRHEVAAPPRTETSYAHSPAAPIPTTPASMARAVVTSRAVDDASRGSHPDARDATGPVDMSPVPAVGAVAGGAASATPSTAHGMAELVPVRDDIALEADATVTAHEISTAHGGLFYLLNAALSLGVYGDFSAPRARGIALSPWDLLAWLGQHWFGRAFRRDPLWGLLADLTGRSPRRAPSWIDPPTRWEPGDDWLGAWAPIATLGHGVDRRAARLHVLHADGFAVFDVPRDTRLRPAAQARALCLTRAGAARARLRPATTMPKALPGDPGLRWLHRFADYLAARCMRALGTTSPRKAVVLLCRHAADVRCDASRVEIALPLSGLPLPVRIAGLDRDPGWIPAAGRDVRFHFS